MRAKSTGLFRHDSQRICREHEFYLIGVKCVKISKEDISDHGIESIRLVDQGIKQGKSAVKTTARAAKTTVSAPKKAFQLTRAVINITTAVISHTVAVLFNPVFLIAAVIFIVIFLCSTVIILAAGSESSNQQMTAIGGAYMTMIGIDDISKRYPDAVGYYTIACDNSRNAFSAKIDALYYQDDDLPHSDLMYMKKDDCGMQTEYLKGFASDTYKSMLKNAWSIAIPEREAVAIAYVYLEKQANDAKETKMGIYDVAFTQDVFTKIVDTAVKVSESSFSGQQCAPPSCTKKTQTVQNPAYAEAYDAFEQCCVLWNTWGDFVREPCNAYADKLYEYEHTVFHVDAQQEAMEKALQKCMDDLETAVNSWYTLYGSRSWDIDENILDYGYSVLGAEYDEAEETLNDTPKTIEETYLTCDGHHTYHSFGFYSYPSNSVMDALGFTDEYKQWMSMCQNGIPKQEGAS